jgi:GNAT superfamily N-acetyltransferase
VKISIAATDAEIAACYPVMRQLRPHVVESEFAARVREYGENGYKLVYLEDGDEPVAVAGIRIGENLAWGRFLYVDDLVTAADRRSEGYGTRLLAWIRDYACEAGCVQLHLDSGMQRVDAHRFYEREGVKIAGFHFAETLSSDP